MQFRTYFCARGWERFWIQIYIKRSLLLLLLAPSQELHEHNIDNEDAVVDVPYYIHYSGKRNKLTLHDEHTILETLG